MIVFGQKTIILITLKLLACRTDSLERLPSVALILIYLGPDSVLLEPQWFLSILKAFLAMSKRLLTSLCFFPSRLSVLPRYVNLSAVCSDFLSLSWPQSYCCWSSGRSVQQGQRDWLYSLTHADGCEVAAAGHHQKGILSRYSRLIPSS